MLQQVHDSPPSKKVPLETARFSSVNVHHFQRELQHFQQELVINWHAVSSWNKPTGSS